MFKKILIANRGEIACRVIRSCQKLGIGSVAVYSEADANALHVRMADEAVFVGPPAAAESYLQIEKIVDACKATGAEAVHPGYGFLSENAAFAEALEAAGIAFIGPPVAAIGAMGDKIESKRLAVEAGVSTVPGHPDPVNDVADAARIAGEIGYPVMIKAAAGGGGKGMRIAFDEGDVKEGLERSQSEARSSFGDDRVFIEKYIQEPRHIEIQVLGDKQGNVIYLGERECSIQRRHQKVIEEAPSPFLDEATRRAMGEQSVALAKAVGYFSAGTVEFIVDKDKNFYFLEMNTRLQVEHPVTELVTGLDLVEQMIGIAAGERLTLDQSDVQLTGWAVEARVYAEDPGRGFLPAIGRLQRYIEPEGEGIRVDSGVVEGSEVTMFYDPMLSKLCAYGSDRATAIDRLSTALDGYYVRGPRHNMAFLSALLHHERFRAGNLSTNFIADEFGERFEGVPLSSGAKSGLAALAATLSLTEAKRAAQISGQLTSKKPSIPVDWVVSLGEEDVAVQVGSNEHGHHVEIDGARVDLNLDWQPGKPLARAKVSGREVVVQVDPMIEGYQLTHGGVEVKALVRTKQAADFAARMPKKEKPDLSKWLMSPMPGLIVSIAVTSGEEVKAGQELAVLEAMKMENVLRAEQDGVVETVKVEAGATVAADEILIAFG
ncbi:MAG: acetyl-CoA carboxylase biotin carboxylase subunit [Geminicoccales bacterium]